MVNSVDKNASETLVRHLVSRGHRKIAFVTSKRYQGNLYASHRFDAIGSTAVELLIDEIEGRCERPRHLAVNAETVIRS